MSEKVELKKELSELIKEFEKDCENTGKERWPRDYIKPTFENFCLWLDDRTWDMR